MNQLLLFAKAPRPGLVKTRLAQSLGKDNACHAYQHLLRTLARRLKSLENIIVQYSPPDAEAELRPFFPPSWQFRPQHGADLGARLHHAIAKAFDNDAKTVCAIGSDCPYLTTGDIQKAWSQLDQHDLVVGPAHDGGYWLIGLNQPQPHLFQQIDWGTHEVFNQTLARARDRNLRVALLRKLSDIDTVADWHALVADSAFDLQ